MPLTELPEDGNTPRAFEELTEVGNYPSSGEGFEHGLVILSMGEAYWLLPADSRYRLMVESRAVERAREQLFRYDRECSRWPPRPLEGRLMPAQSDLVSPLLWAFVVILVFWAQSQWPGKLEEMGSLDGRVLGHFEVWRIFTSLFLHADSGHLLSNLLGGVFVFSAVATTMGRHRGWIYLAVASCLGNLASVALRASQPYQSLGASTAVFAGLGMLTGRAARLYPSGAPGRTRGAFVPVASGVIVLTLFGAGGVEVDAIAHLTGFAAGFAAGIAAASRELAAKQTAGRPDCSARG